MARGRKTALTIRLTAAERETLTRWQRSTTIRAGYAKRGRIILLLADGMSLVQIAAMVGTTCRGVYTWTQRFLQGGLEGLVRRLLHLSYFHMSSVLWSNENILEREGLWHQQGDLWGVHVYTGRNHQ